MESIERLIYFIQTTYSVNPLVFLFFYVLSIPIYWYGWYLVALGFIKRSWQRIAWGITINRFAWFLPYLYVVTQGNDLPKWFWVSLFALLLSSSLLFVTKIRTHQVPREINWLMTKLGLIK
ncbi:MAG: hypothetical protein K6T91_06930 [Firmicutes bacterium]|nr:hypothetical protein [Bacillota bacterium]